MVVASTATDERDFLLLGLSDVNVERLQAGQPIRISRESHGMAVPERLTIVIITGSNEESMKNSLTVMGLIGPDTVIDQRRPL